VQARPAGGATARVGRPPAGQGGPVSERMDPPTTPLGRWDRPLTKVVVAGAGVMLLLGAARSVAAGEARPFVGAVVFVAVLAAMAVPLQVMQRSGRGIAAPMGTAESRWSMVAYAGVQAVAAAAGAVWALSAGHTAFAVALGAWVVFCLVGVVAALVGPVESMRGLRPSERPTPG